ncbi:hypothetical protein AArcCO_0902 [Halalkaliarchaeum sp. AArc-CO]|uniref:DUF2250 domain-containing protein n=1 Tax=unclassified Halalkaliarchaeum TaxID=2678344 RepID=UPI00217ED950|nr:MULTISPECIES: DUF2250 domain-containing protein [unclassified Halalkaliarchaeum]MDR5672871.1 DUF2250 domain-containing protein [Halalkaliarchaeum sp. AArc-GB]UWG50219.1 hypothetical protein AArcCO_0902 [Halalkaliarchaeum sp. AArc-CO]
MSRPGPEELTDADRRVLSFLHTNGAEFPALIASNTGLYVTLAERRCAFLEEAGYIESVDEATVYRLTEHGIDYLESKGEGWDRTFPGADSNRASD